ncbi:MAG: sensor histidine kinase [Anaerolineae bacterium]|nr:sensor histidine kinase [Anaerolineae bacterium]
MTRRKRTNNRPDAAPAEGWLFFVIETLVIAAGYVGVLRNDPRFQEPARLALLTALLVAHTVLLWLSPRLISSGRRLAIYLVVQLALVTAIGQITLGQWLGLALYMGLTGLSVAALWPNLRAIGVVIAVTLGLSTYNLAMSWGWRAFAQFLPTLGIIVAFVVIYVGLFIRQTQARERAQGLLRELEIAHRQLQDYAARVEELTISQERQRMAQELHDTLAQGLAGLILQLDAADSHLEMGDVGRARETVQRAMDHARTTLREARRAIQALRPAALEQSSLVDALGREVDQFAATTGIHAAFQVTAGPVDVPPAAAQDILRIVQESLTNVARHAQAAHVLVRVEARDDRLRVVVEDDGSGFDPDEAAGQAGAYGLRGMRERAGAIGADLRVRSAPGKGTTVTLEMEWPDDPRVDRR